MSASSIATEGFEEVKPRWFKFGKAGDHIRGTLVEVRKGTSNLPGKEGEPTTNYVTKVLSGEYHDIDEMGTVASKATALVAGDTWTVGGRVTIDEKMRDVKVGQQFIIHYVEDKPSTKKGFRPQKVMKVLKGAMNPDFGMDEVKEDPSFLMNA